MSSNVARMVVPSTLAEQGREERRLKRRGLLVSLALLFVMVAPPVIWLALARGTSPADGTLTYPSTWSSRGVQLEEDTEGARNRAKPTSCRAPLQKGDVVTAVDGQSLESLASGPDRGLKSGVVEYTVIRGTESCAFPVTIGDYPWGSQLRAHALAFLLPFGASAWPFGTQVVDVANGPRLWPFVVGDAANGLLWGALLHFSLVFPRPLPLVRRRRGLVLLAYAVPFVLYGGYVVAHLLPDLYGPDSSSLDRLSYLMTISIASARIIPLVVAGVVVWQYLHAEGEAERRRVRWVVYALLIIAAIYLGLGQVPDLFGDPLVNYDWLLVVFLGLHNSQYLLSSAQGCGQDVDHDSAGLTS